ncbi:ZIP family metal transporter [Mechercharimyces sp. CAU 1602]|uniref:ZIP family metal transporter n=1 Tax=Mechercharimyces sp. CAU 1602 TaxID=2973933 RepID=UPI0021613F5E|nr:ZIP family metal transporter [Mechercharimyces sp. CAU 1602]MCS1351999.1 ZIP family metal transporter [Mechercharimyces sp. CAU 1602]
MSTYKKWIYGLLPIVLLALVIVGLFSGIERVFQPSDIPQEEITFDRVWMEEGVIKAKVTNTGADPVTITQVVVNGAIWEAQIEPQAQLDRLDEAELTISHHWVYGEPYEVTVLTEVGTKFTGEVPIAMEAPKANGESLILFALIGLFVGVIPVLLGLLWKPFVSQLKGNAYTFILSITAGLLVFLGIDSLVEAWELANELPDAYQGIGLLLFSGLGTFLLLMSVGDYGQSKLNQKSGFSGPLMISYLIAFGIGIHNLGEGLAIGASFSLGEVALGAFLIMGFTLHNITEGLAIVAPIAREKMKRSRLIMHLILLGLLGGAPAIFGTWIGGYLYSQVWALVFLAIGSGAIFQVVLEVVKMIRAERKENLFSPAGIAGLVTGILIMLVTAVFVTI